MAFRNLSIFLCISVIHARQDCPTSKCTRDGIAINFPFWLQGQKLQNCGPPGFNISCNSEKQATLNLPNSGEFHVSYINYILKRVVLYDPNGCLLSRLLSLNLSSSPFTVVSYQNYTLFSCPKAWGSSVLATTVECISNTTTDVLITKHDGDAMQFPMCKKIFTVPVPVQSGDYNPFPVRFELTWNNSITSMKTRHLSLQRIIALSIIIPALAIPALIACGCLCACLMRGDNTQVINQNQSSGVTGASVGLDKSTIETYRKITVGESQRIQGPNGTTCTICLGDYAPNEAIRIIPKCNHCFHVECIDKWLSINGHCPLCRKSLVCDSCQ